MFQSYDIEEEAALIDSFDQHLSEIEIDLSRPRSQTTGLRAGSLGDATDLLTVLTPLQPKLYARTEVIDLVRSFEATDVAEFDFTDTFNRAMATVSNHDLQAA